MKKIAGTSEVDRALKSLKTSIKAALKGLNSSAARVMAKGDYAAAEALAARGREILEFQAEIEALRQKWRQLRGTGHASKKAVTPLWHYYQPILKALCQSGGESGLAELEPRVEKLFGSRLQVADREPLAGRERWRSMIRRARKHLVTEGWIEKRKDSVWRITEEGRRAAERSHAANEAGAN